MYALAQDESVFEVRKRHITAHFVTNFHVKATTTLSPREVVHFAAALSILCFVYARPTFIPVQGERS